MSKPSDMGPAKAKVEYKQQNKTQYLNNLKRAFARNKYIDVKFSEIGENGEDSGCGTVTRSANNKNMYGVRLRQEWKSSNYSDDGYVFLLWEFKEGTSPVVHVRTWQPDMIGSRKLDEDEVFNENDFFIP